MLIRDQDVDNIVLGNTLSEDGYPARNFDYMLSNPPFGVEWKKVRKGGQTRARGKGLRRPLRPRPAACVRRLHAVPAAPGLEDGATQGR